MSSEADDGAKWKLAQERAQRTATWAKTMTKVIIRKNNKGGPAWKVVDFLGPARSESRGIVDLLAIRKSHQLADLPLKRGDLFEMILIQVKGGTAKRPTDEEIERLELVRKAYDAKTILLSEWKRGSEARFFELVGGEWIPVPDPAVIFR